MSQALQAAAAKDPELLRRGARGRRGARFARGDLCASPAWSSEVIELGQDWRDEPFLGPDRDELAGHRRSG